MTNYLYEDIYNNNKNFSFGKNWKYFLERLDDEKINIAKESLVNFLGGIENIKDKTFVDIGCGSGLFSMCAYLLGAKEIISVDVDENSIWCAKQLHQKQGNPSNWKIITGSALDKEFLSSLGKFDIVYSRGVLHHTGNMYLAFENVKNLISEGGLFYLAIYNKYEGFPNSNQWLTIKKFYSNSNKLIKFILNYLYASQILLFRILRGVNPLKYVKKYSIESVRGMDFFTDVKDWLGGYPYEFASIEEIKNHFEKDGMKLINIYDRSIGTGCNEFLFKKL